jgi:hypothetical protein
MPTATANDFVTQLRARLDARIAERHAAKEALDALLAAPAAENRDLNAAESAQFAELRSKLTTLDVTDPTAAGYDDSIAAIQNRYNELVAVESRSFEIAERTPAPNVSVRKEERTYGRHAERRGISFLKDVAGAQIGNDYAAQQRLQRHMQEEIVERAEYLGGITGAEVRDATTAAFAGLVVPQYLTDLVAPAIKNKRPFLDVCNKHPLPEMGMQLNLSRITTQTTVTVQATENAAASETDIDDTLLTVNVRTYSGQNDLSRQAVERGTGTDDITIQDLIGSYHASLDAGCLNDDGTSGTHVGVRNVAGNAAVTYTDASPTAAELHPKLADLIAQISADRHGRDPAGRPARRDGLLDARSELPRRWCRPRPEPPDEPRGGHQRGPDRRCRRRGVSSVGGPERSDAHPCGADRCREPDDQVRRVRLQRVHGRTVPAGER